MGINARQEQDVRTLIVLESAVDFDQLSYRAQNLEFVQILRALADAIELESVDSFFYGREVDEIAIHYDDSNQQLVATAAIVR
jgi:hypothetical protein